VTRHFLRDLDRLRRAVLLNGSAVEAAVEKAILALAGMRVELAEEVIEGDAKIDERELEIESECMKILALHQPVAQDLRFLVTVLKVNNDLERIGDLAVNLAERVIYLSAQPRGPVPEKIGAISRKTRAMVRDCLDTLFEPNVEAARLIVQADDAVDDLKDKVVKELQESMHEDATRIEANVCLIAVARDLERIADMATNIAEDIVFMVQGELIRHAYRRTNPDL